MNKRTTGLVLLLLGIASLLGAATLLVSGILRMTKSFVPLATFSSPGEVSVKLEEAGVFTLWHDHKTMHRGTGVQNSPNLPGGFHYQLVRDNDGKVFELEPPRANSTFSTPERESKEVGTFTTTLPGMHTLTVSHPEETARVFSLSEGNLIGGMTEFGMQVMLAVVAGFLGLVLLILGIIFMLRRKGHRTANPQLPPPPPVA